MDLQRRIRLTGLAALLTAMIAMPAIACGGKDGESAVNLPPGGYGMTQEQWDRLGESGASGGAQATATVPPAAFPTPTARPQPTSTPRPPAFPDDGTVGEQEANVLENQVAQAAPERIIVRNVDMSIEAPDVAQAIDQISLAATQSGGWVVRTQHTEVHSGAIDIRVPAERLEDTLRTLRSIASNVKSEISTSQDFTEEFTDANARIRTLQDTVNALRALFDRAVEIEDALAIQQEITSVQADLEALQARVNFLSESAAFSLVRIQVLALPQPMEVTVGEDVLAAAGRGVQFRAEFTPPQGIENFTIEWDFGDGSGRQTVNRVAPVNIEGRVVSAPVTHTYNDDADSPYIVRVTAHGTGESGAAEGEDVVIVTVSRVPAIEVFAGDDQTVDAGETVKFRSTFTRPQGVTDLEYTWDFGDGTAPVTVPVEPDGTVAAAEHTFATSKPQPYNVVVKISGQTPAGATEGTDNVNVLVEPQESLTAGTFDPGGTSKNAVRALSAIGSAIGTAAIWFAILSPLWIALGIVVWAIWWTNRRNERRRQPIRISSRRDDETPGN